MKDAVKNSGISLQERFMLYSIPVFLFAFPVSFVIGFLNPNAPLFWGFTGRHLPVFVFGLAMLLLCSSCWIEGAKKIIEDVDWTSPKDILGSFGWFVALTIMVICVFINSFFPEYEGRF